jgi:hypothetical protein
MDQKAMVYHCMPQALFAVLLGLAFCLAMLQGYWRHDAWIYTSSEFHEALDGKFLADPLHHVMHGLPPEASLVLSLLVIYAFLRSELVRISGSRRLATMPHVLLVLGLFSSGLLSQLHWPTHTLAACLPLALVCLLPRSKTLMDRVVRALIVTLGSFFILSSFVFFAPLCLVPERGALSRAHQAGGVRCMARGFLSYFVSWPAVLVGCYAFTRLVKGVYGLFGVALPAGRIEAAASAASFLTGSLEGLSSTLRVLFLRQWGSFSPLIVICLVLVLLVALDDVCMRLWRGWSVPGRSPRIIQSIDAASLLICVMWLLLCPVLAILATGTAWQRVVLAWAVIPALLCLAAGEIRQPGPRRILSLSLAAASASSALIGLYNFGSAALFTRRTVDDLRRQISGRPSAATLYVVDVKTIASLTPRYAWGGWPPFASEQPDNPRMHRALDELNVRHYIIRYGSNVFHPDPQIRQSLDSFHAGGNRSLGELLLHYSRLMRSDLSRITQIQLRGSPARSR